jgi:hypothetical protein
MARALNCEFHYVLLPRRALTEMVRRQALRKATDLIAERTSRLPVGEDEALVHDAVSEDIRALVHSLIDKRGLWREEDRR